MFIYQSFYANVAQFYRSKRGNSPCRNREVYAILSSKKAQQLGGAIVKDITGEGIGEIKKKDLITELKDKGLIAQVEKLKDAIELDESVDKIIPIAKSLLKSLKQSISENTDDALTETLENALKKTRELCAVEDTAPAQAQTKFSELTQSSDPLYNPFEEFTPSYDPNHQKMVSFHEGLNLTDALKSLTDTIKDLTQVSAEKTSANNDI